MATERTRIDEERVAKERRERAVLAEREARERRQMEEAALKAAAERDLLLEEERRRREEQARLDGIRTAEVQRVRDQAAQKVALETAAAGREHELKLASIRQAGSIRTLRAATVATSIVALAACAALAWLELGVEPERTARLEAALTGLRDAERARADRTEGLLRASEASRRDLEQKLAARAAEPPAAPPATAPKPPTGRRLPAGHPTPGVKSGICTGDPHDPLNGCLPH